ncbi:MAG: putative glutamine amidotransferase [Thermoleophilaceae bacterium]|jgi:putative glutamine amidotransferase|nr:putative glutamine amidotransferase [Thermoleophilaceae bacterium]
MAAVPPARPLIGLTTSEIRQPERREQIPHADAGREEMVLGLSYLRALSGAGGAPVVLPPPDLALVPSLLAGLAGVCLSGGPDIDPQLYGGPRHPQLGPTHPDLDRFELAVVREAARLGMPLLAICRGAQMLNVAHGGDLRQHLPEDLGDEVCHQRAGVQDPACVHEIRVEPDSVLGRALGAERLEVNSFHHQAPGRIGDGLCAVAWAPDGVLEGIEAPDREFWVGVQWHAEAIADRPEQRALLAAFVAAAGAYADRTDSTARSASSSQRSGSAGGAVSSATGMA